jgi:hypothetical protein
LRTPNAQLTKRKNKTGHNLHVAKPGSPIELPGFALSPMQSACIRRDRAISLEFKLRIGL